MLAASFLLNINYYYFFQDLSAIFIPLGYTACYLIHHGCSLLVRYYPCVIDEILEDGTCSVVFEGYDQSEVTQVCSARVS